MDDQADGQTGDQPTGRPAGRKRGKRQGSGNPAGRVALTLKLPPDVIHRLKLHSLQEARTASDLVASLVEQHCRTYTVSKRWAGAGQGGRDQDAPGHGP